MENIEQSKEPLLTLSFDRGTLLLQTDDSITLANVFKGVDIKYDQRVFKWRCDAIFYTTVREQASRAGFQLDDSVGEWEDVSWPQPELPELRQIQKEALHAWMQSKRGVIVMPTGTGKTEVALAIMRELCKSTLIVAPVRDLMYQWHRRILKGLGYDAGIIGDNTFNLRPVSVTTYDSAYIHMETLGAKFGLIIFDECHHLPGSSRREAALMCAAPLRMGLTATPQRSDGREKDLEWLIGPMVYNIPIASTRGKELADYDVFRIPVHLIDQEQEQYNASARIVRDYMIRRKEEDPSFEWQDLMAETGKDPDARAAQQAFYFMKSIQDRAVEKFRVLEDIFRLHMGTPIIIFTGSNVMARDISKRFLIPCLLNHCGKKERLEILDGFRDGVYPALVANRVLDEGVDLPEAKVAVVVGGNASIRQAIQRLGRILRKTGHKRGILYEVVCQDTREVIRSRQRRRSDAYEGTRHRRL
jgi:superfamily II DNA or RNA helicase